MRCSVLTHGSAAPRRSIVFNPSFASCRSAVVSLFLPHSYYTAKSNAMSMLRASTHSVCPFWSAVISVLHSGSRRTLMRRCSSKGGSTVSLPLRATTGPSLTFQPLPRSPLLNLHELRLPNIPDLTERNTAYSMPVMPYGQSAFASRSLFLCAFCRLTLLCPSDMGQVAAVPTRLLRLLQLYCNLVCSTICLRTWVALPGTKRAHAGPNQAVWESVLHDGG